jgi:hypothetical protein
MLKEFEFKKIGENDNLVNLQYYQKRKVEEFDNWLTDSINEKKINLFYRGVDEEHKPSAEVFVERPVHIYARIKEKGDKFLKEICGDGRVGRNVRVVPDGVGGRCFTGKQAGDIVIGIWFYWWRHIGCRNGDGRLASRRHYGQQAGKEWECEKCNDPFHVEIGFEMK